MRSPSAGPFVIFLSPGHWVVLVQHKERDVVRGSGDDGAVGQLEAEGLHTRRDVDRPLHPGVPGAAEAPVLDGMVAGAIVVPLHLGGDPVPAGPLHGGDGEAAGEAGGVPPPAVNGDGAVAGADAVHIDAGGDLQGHPLQKNAVVIQKGEHKTDEEQEQKGVGQNIPHLPPEAGLYLPAYQGDGFPELGLGGGGGDLLPPEQAGYGQIQRVGQRGQQGHVRKPGAGIT